jgi:arylsulfatase A-like enzyme
MYIAPNPPGPRRPENAPYVVAIVAAAFVSFVTVGATMRGVQHFRSKHPAPSGSDSSATLGPGTSGGPVTPKQGGPGAIPAGSKRTYNVVLLTIDTLRADLGFAGYPRPITPQLDELARRSTVFERAYATASYTPKSMGPLLIGRYATETARNGEHYTTFFPSNTFVAERARAAGVRTIAGVCHRYFLWKKGFQEGQDIYDTSAAHPEPRDDDPRVTSDRLSDTAIRLLGRPENSTPKGPPGRFLAWFHYIDPHTPYVPHKGAPDFASMPPAGAPSLRAAYDAEVWFTDSQLGRVIDFVRSQPWGNDTAIIITADHGEAFGEHGHWRHGREVWEPLIRVPLIINLPPSSPAPPEAAPRRIALKRSHIDLVPTILDLLGVELKDALHGKSLLADMRAAPNELEERDVFVDMPKGPYNEARRAIVTGPSPGIKLIHFGGHRYEAYDLASDPAEAHSLSRSDERFKVALQSFERTVSSLDDVTPSQ